MRGPLIAFVLLIAPVRAFRVQSKNGGGLSDTTEAESSTLSQASCDFTCGASEAHFEHVLDTGSSANVTFPIGLEVEYKPQVNECLSACSVIDYSELRMWQSAGCPSGTVKVSKVGEDDAGHGADLKLCCKPKPCTFDPKSKDWVTHVSGDDKTFRPLEALNDIQEVEQNACLCCDTPKDEFQPWGYEVQDHCKLGYTPSHIADPVGKNKLRHWTIRLSNSAMERQCSWYCGHYEGYKHPKYTPNHLYLTGNPGEDSLEETAAGDHMSYRDICFDDYVSIVAKAGMATPTASIPRHDFETYNEKWDRVIATKHQANGCVLFYRLECPRANKAVKRAAIVEYKKCCSGNEVCSLPGNSTEGLVSTTFLGDSLRGSEKWKTCANTVEKAKLYTHIEMAEGIARFSPGAQIVGLRQQTSSGCMFAEVSATQELLSETYQRCPWGVKEAALGILYADSYTDHVITSLIFGKNTDTPVLAKQKGMFDLYTTMMYGLMVHMSLRPYAYSHKEASERMAVPTVTRPLNKCRAYEMTTPLEEIDTCDDMDLGQLLGELNNCAFLTARALPIVDDVGNKAQSNGINSWEMVLKGDQTKADFLQQFFNYKNEAGDDVYPAALIDYSGLFKRGDMFDDMLEKDLAFNGITSHRVQLIPLLDQEARDGETAVYSVDFRFFGAEALKTRDLDFAKWGAEMRFSAEGMPLMVRFPDNTEVWKSSASPNEWQYAKFVWRSTVINGITLLDHLWFTHFYMANTMSTQSRELLPPAHPLRRLLALFTWGTPLVNQGAAHQLAGPKAMLQRMTPFRDFGMVSKVVQDVMPSLETYYTHFLENTTHAFPELLANAPFYQDGRDFFNVMATLVDDFMNVYKSEWCSSDGHVIDMSIIGFFEQALHDTYFVRADRARMNWEWLQLAGQDPSGPNPVKRYRCAGLARMLKVGLFSVTGWHRHVGTVADLMRDPELTSPSWKVGHRVAQPRQAMQAALIAATTGFTNPKLGKNSWAFAFDGMVHDDAVKQIVGDWERRLGELKNIIDKRNKGRAVPYYNMHPDHVENSVAV